MSGWIAKVTGMNHCYAMQAWMAKQVRHPARALNRAYWTRHMKRALTWELRQNDTAASALSKAIVKLSPSA